jgi:hypothetical protein
MVTIMKELLKVMACVALGLALGLVVSRVAKVKLNDVVEQAATDAVFEEMEDDGIDYVGTITKDDADLDVFTYGDDCVLVLDSDNGCATVITDRESDEGREIRQQLHIY